MPGGQTNPTYRYTPAQQRRLVQNLPSLYPAIDSRQYHSHPYTPHLIKAWHGRLFDGVRDHAGRIRSRDFGPEVLVFGPNRSVHRDFVLAQLVAHCSDATSLIAELDARSAKFDIHSISEAVKVSSYVHADLIRIHPVIDGNGRVARVVLDWILQGVGFPNCIAFHIPGAEYKDVLNHYYATTDIDPLIDLVLRALSFPLT